jgi:tellurite resistance protein
MSSVDSSLLDKVLRTLRAPHAVEPQRSAGDLLTASAAAYGARPALEEHTAPTGFDPMAAVLFESIVESAFLIANADGDFDEQERAVLVAVVQAASGGTVTERQVEALLADLAEQLTEDGLEARVEWVAKMVRKPEQKTDVLRIAAVLAHASAGVSDSERDTLLKLGHAMGIEASAVDTALQDAATALH